MSLQKFSITPSPLVCSERIDLELDGTRIRKLTVIGGCDGNLHGIMNLVEGMEAADVIRKLKGIPCGGKPTSCPDQIALALEKLLQQV